MEIQVLFEDLGLSAWGQGRYDDALKRVEQIRALEDKEALKLTTGLTTKAIIAALRCVHDLVGESGMDAPFLRAVLDHQNH